MQFASQWSLVPIFMFAPFKNKRYSTVSVNMLPHELDHCYGRQNLRDVCCKSTFLRLESGKTSVHFILARSD